MGRIAANRAGALRESGSRRRHFAAVGFTFAQNRDSENRESADGNSPSRRFLFLRKASAAASYPDVERRRETKGRQGRSPRSNH